MNRRSALLGTGIVSLAVIVSLAFTAGRAAAAPPAAANAAPPAAPPPEKVEFFEARIRPLLVEKCLDCHADDANGDLQLDSAAAVLRGGRSGPVIVPGKPAESRLMHAVRGEKGLKSMPPDDPLTQEQIADLAKWIEQGAVDPRTGPGAASPLEKLFAQAKDHWAFQPISNPQPPAVKATHLVRTPIDAFIQSALEAKGWSMSPVADSRTLLRRATLDLTGLPPTAAEVDAFAANPSSAAFDSAVDRLLESPRYGERWARHWLDVARYADSMGSVFGDNAYPFAWTYRDWCIRALNEDLPFDRFVVAQLAADLTTVKPGDNRDLAALGFLTVGRRPGGDVGNDSIDDRIDVISRGLLGLTVTCARCHDHKVEPISTVDYYGLYGVLKSCTDKDASPLMEPQPPNPHKEAFEAEGRRVREYYLRLIAFEAEKGVVRHRSRLGDYLMAAHDGKWKLPKDDDGLVERTIIKPRRLDAGIYTGVVQKRKAWLEAHPEIFRPWLELSSLSPEEYSTKAPAMIAGYMANADQSLSPIMEHRFGEEQPVTLTDVAGLYSQLAQSLDFLWGERFRGALDGMCTLRPDELEMGAGDLAKRAIERVHEAQRKALVPERDDPKRIIDFMKALIADGSPFVFLQDATNVFPSRDVGFGLRRMAGGKVGGLVNHPGAPVRVMAVSEGKPFDSKVLIRGNPQSPGAAAPRQFLSVLRKPDAQPFPKDSSGRRELAALIASPDNPLTARVIVNRVWGWHFGRGLVRTASDFGLRGDPPTHPELLDWLASRFIADGWSLKKLHRLIMQSHVYRQSAAVGEAAPTEGSARAVDPDALLLWRYPARAVEFESLRDSMLAVGGGLDPTVGGRPFDLGDPLAGRRTIYARIPRSAVPQVMRVFDVPDSNFTSGGRLRTSQATQALWLFNSPFVVEASKRLAKLARREAGGSEAAPASVVRALWRAALQRDPSPGELADVQAYVAAYPQNDIVRPQADDWAYGFADFDAATGTVKGFTPIADFQGAVVKGKKEAGFDASTMEFTPEGGRAAPGKAAVRRWIAPEKASVRIDAELVYLAEDEAAASAAHAAKPVICRIIHSRHGPLGEWKASPAGVMTTVESAECEPGDTIDFVVLTEMEPSRSVFVWAPMITMVDREMPAMPGMKMQWDARYDFLDPKAMPKPLDAWEELAQVLLASGEFSLIP